MPSKTLLSVACAIQLALTLLLSLGGAASVFLLKSERTITMKHNGHVANQLLVHASPDMKTLRREADPLLQDPDDQLALMDWFYRFPIERAERRHRENAWIFFIAAGASALTSALTLTARCGCRPTV